MAKGNKKKPAPAPAPAPKEEQKVKIEDDKDSSDDEPPSLESEPQGTGNQQQDKAAKQSRAEKKSRKAIQKLGMKPVPGVVRVTVKKAKSMLFVITKPDVFKSPNSDTYIIFGEAKIEDPTQRGLEEAAGQWNKPIPSTTTSVPAAAATAAPGEKPSAPQEPDEPVDETGLNPTDIDLVIAQTKASRSAAVKALRKHNGDIVNAIMDLTL